MLNNRSLAQECFVFGGTGWTAGVRKWQGCVDVSMLDLEYCARGGKTYEREVFDNKNEVAKRRCALFFMVYLALVTLMLPTVPYRLPSPKLVL